MAYSSIENKYLSALTALQFPDEPVEDMRPEQFAPGRQPNDLMLAAGPSQTMTDAGGGGPMGSIKAIDPTRFEKALETTGLTLEQAGRFLDSLGQVDVPLLGKISLADFVPFVGTAKQGSRSVLGESQWQGTPMALQQAGTGQSLTRGTGFARQMTEDASLAAMDIGMNIVPVGKMVASGGKALAKETGQQLNRAMMEGTGPLAAVVPQAARPMFAVQPGPNLVSTRLPTAVKRTEDPLTSRLVIDLQATKQDPNAFAYNMGLIRQYPNFASKARNPDRQAEDFITEVKNNLLFLHDQVPDATRQRSKLWYDGARTIADRFSLDYGVPDQAVSGVLAVLSPQKDWFMNVSLGQRVLDIATKQQSTRWDSSMDVIAKTIFGDAKYAPMVNAIRGKTLAEVKEPGLKAMWLRTYDQAKNPREHQIVSPEGDFVGVRMNQDGKTPTQTGWGSLNEIGKAIVILEDPRIDTISMNLGQQHKVRNFYSNIYAPNDPAGPVTIDTHAVAAGLLRPLSGNSREVLHNFGSGVLGEGGPKNSSITGVQGTYGIYAEAYRRAAAERGILPREMQSITWEAVRGLYPDTFKSQAKNVDQIDGIWLQYRKGKMSLEEARNEVFRNAGGIRPPEWEGAGLRPGSAQAVQPSGYTGELPGAGVPGGGAPGAGGVQPATGNPTSVTGGRRAPTSGAK
jgi:hypothetical protein